MYPKGGFSTEKILSEHEANQFSPLALAFLGDSIYEQKVRERLLLTANMPAGKLHKLAVEKVCAQYQSQSVEIILSMNILTKMEAEVLKRGKNTKVNPPKHATISQYRNATGLECLFGFLRLTGQNERIQQLFDICWNMSDDK